MRRGAVLGFVGCVTTVCSVASADDLTWDRHPRHAGAALKPAGVPAEYVLTHNGFFHPSCVVSIRSDEVWGTDAVIRGMDGVEHERIEPCAYPRYNLAGRALPVGAPATERQARRARRESNAVVPDLAAYDGWLTWYDTNVIKVAPGSTLVTEWIVPLLPTNMGTQDIAFFNDFETQDIILQPVLDFSEIPGAWAIESENCCGPSGNGNDVQSALVQVSPGDVIRGEIDMATCNAAGDCTNWTVKTTDVTTGMVTSLTMQNPGEAADEVNPAVLETYGITSCDMLPANGEAQFFDNALTNGTAAEPETYVLETILSPPAMPPPPAGFPTTCGYGGKASGNSFTLLFGTSPTPVGDGGDAPVVDAGAPVDASSGGADASASSGGSSGSGSGGGSGSSSGSGGSGSSSGGILDAGKSSGSSSGSGDTPHGPSSQSGGCGCTTAGAEQGAGFLAVGASLVVLGGAVRRRRTRVERVRRSRAHR